MGINFSNLLRSNFRCGRMLHSRTLDMTGCIAIPFLHPML